MTRPRPRYSCVLDGYGGPVVVVTLPRLTRLQRSVVCSMNERGHVTYTRDILSETGVSRRGLGNVMGQLWAANLVRYSGDGEWYALTELGRAVRVALERQVWP